MTLERIGPMLSLAFNLASMAGYAYGGKWPLVGYWLGATIINISLLLM